MSTSRKTLTREEIVAGIQRCAQKLGRTPTVRELRRHTRASERRIRIVFGSWSKALDEAGLEQSGPGYRPQMEELFRDWVGVVRKLGKIPGRDDYHRHSKFSVTPLINRFDNWKRVPAAMRTYLQDRDLGKEYGDILSYIADHEATEPRRPVTRLPWKPARFGDRPIYGLPILPSALTSEPLNEAGVMVLFGALAQDLGFAVCRVQAEFPDCEALYEVEPGICQIIRIEFEFFSRNFLDHQHDRDGCDLIVCWEHNWPECPLPVLELKTEVKRLLAELAYRENALEID